MGILSKVRLQVSRWRYGAWLLVAGVMFVAGYYLIQPLSTEYVAHAQVTTTPFTVQQEFYSFDEQHPSGRLALRLTVARRSDGAIARINQNFDLSGLPEGSVRNVELPDGGGLMAYDDIGSVVRMPQPPPWVVAIRKEAMMNTSSNCVSPGQTLAGYSQIQGYKVAIVDSPQFPGGIKYTAWVAPDLGCQTLESLSEVARPDGSFAVVGKTKLVRVTAGEPDASLFKVPSSYRTAMPSEAMREEVSHLGKQWTDKLETIAQAQDAAYLKRQDGDWGTPPKAGTPQGTGGASPSRH